MGGSGWQYWVGMEGGRVVVVTNRWAGPQWWGSPDDNIVRNPEQLYL
uniref:Uncharacterized protein n=1 Tax=Anguilla anguilla TaxID=7936 RepID=A0A0E9WKW3_ANGAN